MGTAPHNAPVFDETAPIVGRTQVALDTFRLALRAPRVAAAARAGQFVNVLLPSPDFGYRLLGDGEAWAPSRPFLIRRPFSIHGVEPSGRSGQPDTITLLVKVVGPGTRRLVELPGGASVKVLGPLGNGFGLPPGDATAALVAGGCGWASLAMLARELRRLGHPTFAFIGARSEETLPVALAERRGRRASFLRELPEACVTAGELEALGITVGLAAEEGGRVYGGLVTDLFAAFLREAEPSRLWVYACGPRPMLARVAELARGRAQACQVALEELMACGMGVCNSCVVEVALPDGSRGHKKLCVDGPVLDAEEVIWGGSSA